MAAMKKLLAYLELFRFPNVFTAVADVMMGGFVAGVGFDLRLATLIVASGCLYCAGMTLNDVMDFEADLQERPHRPLPSQRIEQQWARKLAYGLLGAGVVLAGLVGMVCAAVALALALAIYLYDGPLKRTIVAPWIMGSCRSLNVLLGMSAMCDLLVPHQLLICLGLGVYVAGITWFARSEAQQSDVRLLKFGFAVMMSGIVILALLPLVVSRLYLRSPLLWPTLLMLLISSVVRLCVTAIWRPDPTNVMRAVKHSLFTLIVLDAAVTLVLCGPKYALAVVSLTIPATLLGRWVYST